MESETKKVYSILRHTVITFSCPSEIPEFSEEHLHRLAGFLSYYNEQWYEDERVDWKLADLFEVSLLDEKKFITKKEVFTEVYDGNIILHHGEIQRNGKFFPARVYFDATSGSNIYETLEWANKEEAREQVIEMLVPFVRERFLPLIKQMRLDRACTVSKSRSELHSHKKEKRKRKFFFF